MQSLCTCVRTGGGGVWGCVGDRILQEFYTLYLSIFRIYKISRPSQIKKPRMGGGLRYINTCRKVSLQVNFLRRRHFALPSMSLVFVPCRRNYGFTTVDKAEKSNDRKNHKSSCSLKYSKSFPDPELFVADPDPGILTLK
jgi:hypothetical protein